MSRPRQHPIFVSMPRGEMQTCGHQHSTEGQAVNCAKSTLRRRRFMTYVDVVKFGWNWKRDRATQETMLTVTRNDLG